MIGVFQTKARNERQFEIRNRFQWRVTFICSPFLEIFGPRIVDIVRQPRGTRFVQIFSTTFIERMPHDGSDELRPRHTSRTSCSLSLPIPSPRKLVPILCTLFRRSRSYKLLSRSFFNFSSWSWSGEIGAIEKVGGGGHGPPVRLTVYGVAVTGVGVIRLRSSESGRCGGGPLSEAGKEEKPVATSPIRYWNLTRPYYLKANLSPQKWTWVPIINKNIN